MKTRYMIALAAGALALVGCQRENPTDEFGLGDGQIRYSISNVGVKSSADDMSSTGSLSLVSRDGKMTVPATCEVSEGIDLGCGSAETKGELINTTLHDETLPDNLGFTVSAYKNDGSVLFSDEASKRTKTDDYWTMDPPQYWPLSTKLTFYAYTNAGDNTVSQTATSQTLTYTVTEDATAHKDLMLGYYYGNGGNKGIAEMRFDHPLTAVRFKKGLMEDVKGIRSITISRLASGGTVTMDAYGDIGNWTVADTDEYKTKVILSDGEDFLEVDETTKFIGKDSDGNYDGAFLLIPQTLSDHGVTVTVVLAMDYGYDMTVIADITSGAWQAGKTYTYTLGYIVEDPNLLPGMFSVSETEYVRFSKGNLQATYNGSGYTFDFAANQYDYVGGRDGYGVGPITGNNTIDAQTIGAVVDLFGWSTSNTNYGINTNGEGTGASVYGGEFKDWGTAIDDTGRWCTLSGTTSGEWVYLLEKRTVNGGSGEGYTYTNKASGIVLEGNTYYGLFLYPNDYDKPLIGTSGAPSTWNEINASGIVCLPAGGYRYASKVESLPGIRGSYWASTEFGNDKAYDFYYIPGIVYDNLPAHERCYGFSVRLARKFRKQ